LRLAHSSSADLFHTPVAALGQAIRAHANFAEHTPLALLLIGLVEAFGYPALAVFIANLPKHYSEMFHWRLAARAVEAACHSDGAKLVNSATEYMGKALVAEGMDR
jgi:uncharacterized membrane protein YecN with MAPEG domain